MPMSEFEIRKVERAVGAFMKKRRPPIEIREEVDLSFRLGAQSLELFEIRPRWRHPNEKVESSIAKARYVRSRDEWLVYWKRADLKWHKYGPMPSVRSVEQFLALVDEDSYGCFFG